MTEAKTMRYVSSIHVPKVQHVWRWDGVTYITIDVVDGEELYYAWHDMSEMTARL